MLKGASYTGGPTLADGTAAAPSVAFASDPTTGMARILSGLALVVAGAGRLFLASNGAVSAQVPDSTATGGNTRGAGATDLQASRSAAAQVASGANAAIVSGANNISSGSASFVGAGTGNTASGQDTVVSGGASNAAAGSRATVSGGSSNSASATNATVGGGTNNLADGQFSWIPGGAQASARGNYGRGAWGAGFFTTKGDAQAGEFVLRRQTTDATATVLTADGAAPGVTNQTLLPNRGAYMVRGMVVAHQTGGAAGSQDDCAAWTFSQLVFRGVNAANTFCPNGGILSAAPDAGQNVASAAGWRLTVTADTTNGGLALTVTGEASKNINWVARILSVESVG